MEPREPAQQTSPTQAAVPLEEVQYRVLAAMVDCGTEVTALTIANHLECSIPIHVVTHTCRWLAREGYISVTRRARINKTSKNRQRFYVPTEDKGIPYLFEVSNKRKSKKV